MDLPAAHLDQDLQRPVRTTFLKLMPTEMTAPGTMTTPIPAVPTTTMILPPHSSAALAVEDFWEENASIKTTAFKISTEISASGITTTLKSVELTTMTISQLHTYVVPVEEEEVETISALLHLIAKMIFLSPICMVMIALGTPTTLTRAVIMTVIPSLQLQLVAHAEEVLQALPALLAQALATAKMTCL